MKRIVAVGLTVLGTTLMVSGCAFFGWGQADEVNAAFAAGALLDYVAVESYGQVQELEVSADTYDLSVAAGGASQSARAVTTSTVVREYPNVTFTITRELDDRDTPDDPTDDVLTVTRVVDYGFEASAIHVLVRPLKPTTDPDWDSYDSGSQGWAVEPLDAILQSGTIQNSLDAVMISSGTVEATWKRTGDVVYAEELVREMTSVVRPTVIHRTIITQSSDGSTSLTREREVNGVVVHTYTVEPWTDPDDGQIYLRIVRDDGGYAVVRSRGNRLGDPRIVDYYNASDVLVMRVEDVRSGPLGLMTSTRTFYDADGSVIATRVVTYSVNYIEGDEDKVQVTRTVDGRTRTLTITESGDVYIVTLRGEEYRARVLDADTVEFLNANGTVYLTAERTADGWLITSADGQTVI